MNTMNSISAAISTALLCAFLSGCGDSSADTAQVLKKENSTRDVHVRVQELQPRPFAETLQLSGTIRAYDDIMLSPEEGGIVKEWKYAKGQFVQKGTIIAVLNDDVIKSSHDAALAQYKSSELTFEKQRQVYAEQAVSEWQLKTTEYSRDAAKAQAELMQARWERTRIKSPVSGILDERYIDVGEMAPPGVPLAHIVNIRIVRIVVNVPERYSGGVTLGTPISLSVLAYPGHVFSGNISFVGATISPDNRTFPVEAVISNPGSKLKPEMIARVKISLSVQKQALLIEEGIVQQLDRNKLVVFVAQNGKAEERIVQLGGRQDNLVEVVSGLKAGERVITVGYQDIIDGQTVVVARNAVGSETPSPHSKR